VPYKNREGSHGFFGKVVRIDLEDFQTVKVLDLTQYDDRLVGFIGGASWANYGLLIPYRNDNADNNNGRSQHGLIVRFEMSAFDIDHIEFMNLPTMARKQVPSIPDPGLRGYLNGFVMGDYLYLVPHFNQNFYGKLTRVDMRDFTWLVELQQEDVAAGLKQDELLASTATDVITFPNMDTGGVYEGIQYDGVQYIDLQATDQDLAGFSGGFASLSAVQNAHLYNDGEGPGYEGGASTEAARHQSWLLRTIKTSDYHVYSMEHHDHIFLSDELFQYCRFDDTVDERCLGIYDPSYQYFGRADELTEFFSHEYALGDGSSAPYAHVIYISGDPPTRAPVPAPTYA